MTRYSLNATYLVTGGPAVYAANFFEPKVWVNSVRTSVFGKRRSNVVCGICTPLDHGGYPFPPNSDSDDNHVRSSLRGMPRMYLPPLSPPLLLEYSSNITSLVPLLPHCMTQSQYNTNMSSPHALMQYDPSCMLELQTQPTTKNTLPYGSDKFLCKDVTRHDDIKKRCGSFHSTKTVTVDRAWVAQELSVLSNFSSTHDVPVWIDQWGMRASDPGGDAVQDQYVRRLC